jgi:hypothetical protein
MARAGTHKSNTRGPAELYSLEAHQELVHQEPYAAGDAVICAASPPHPLLNYSQRRAARVASRSKA